MSMVIQWKHWKPRYAADLIFRMSRNIITGIAIGTYHVKVVIASAKERNEKGFPKILGTGIAETHGVRHGYVTNVEDVANSVKKAVRQAEEKADAKVKRAFVGISGIGVTSVAVN